MERIQASLKKQDFLLGATLVVVVFLAYTPVWWAGFIWDDDYVVTSNPVIVGPLGLAQIWTTSAANICPLTLSTFWIEYKMWGAAPLPYHLVNVALHAANAVVLWLVLRRLRVPGAWFGAMLWALHPVQAESVVWISEMKNTESGLFYLLTILFFAKSLEQETAQPVAGRWAYVLCLVFAALALAAKSSTVVLPIVLVLCCLWMEGRWHGRSLVKIAPVLLFSIIAAVNSLWNQSLHGANDPRWNRPWLERFAASGDNIWFYLGKLVWPHPLIMTYPGWHIDAGNLLSFLPSLAVVVFTFFLWMNCHSWAKPYLFAWCCFLAALLPVLGFTNAMFFNKSPVADHFQYLASMGPLALAGAVIAAIPQNIWRVLLAGIASVSFAALTFRQAGIDGNSETLWRYVLAWNDESWAAHDHVGQVLLSEGKNDAAIAQFQKVCALAPGYIGGRTNLALAYFNNGEFDRAADNYRLATQMDAEDEDAHTGLAASLLKKGDLDDAIAEYRRALDIAPSDSSVANSLGVVLMQKGKTDEAIVAFQHAVDHKPGFAEFHLNLGNAFTQADHLDNAIIQYREAFRLKRSYADAHNSLGVIFAQQGNYSDAIVEFQEALKIQPGLAMAQKNLTQAQAVMEKSKNPKAK